MPRLGELLVAGGLLTSEQVDQALRAQVMWGGRLGTNLIELETMDLDALSRALGMQHELPSALARHFEKIDKELQKRLSPDLAERFSVVPLFKVDTKILIATTGPLDIKGRAYIADELGVPPDQLVVTVAAELRIRYQLERAYNIPRSARFLRSRGPAFPQFTTAPEVETSDVDVVPVAIDDDSSRRNTNPIVADHPVARPATIDDLGFLSDELVTALEAEPSEEELKARRVYVRTLSESMPAVEPPPDTTPEPPTAVETEAATAAKKQALGRIALRRIATPPQTPLVVEVTARPLALGANLGEATRAIRRASDRDRVVDLMMMSVDKFAPSCDAALLLVVRGDAAIGWRGFSRAKQAIPEIAVPLDQSPIARLVVETRMPTRCDGDELDAIDTLLFRALGGEEGQLVVVPVVIGAQVMCLVAMVGSESAEVEAIAGAGGAAFARLMRDASR